MGLFQRYNLGYLPLIFIFILGINGEQDPSPTVYQVLPKFGLPSGLLPDSVTSYTLSEDGSFEVHLEKPCYIQFEYYVHYEKKITGKLSFGKITELEGIQVRELFLWFGVEEIKVNQPASDSIYFTVGQIDMKLVMEQFQTVRSCRDHALGLCGGSLRSVFELPPVTTDDAQLLQTTE